MADLQELRATRRAFILGAGALIAAPAIVRFELLMPVRNRLVLVGRQYSEEEIKAMILATWSAPLAWERVELGFDPATPNL